MNQKTQVLSDTARRVIHVVYALPYLINEVPRPYSLNFLKEFGGVGKKKTYAALRKLDLLGVLSDDPSEAIQRATALLPQALESSESDCTSFILRG